MIKKTLSMCPINVKEESDFQIKTKLLFLLGKILINFWDSNSDLYERSEISLQFSIKMIVLSMK